MVAMRKAERFWRALERAPRSAVRSHWEEEFGEDFSAAEPFVRSTGELACSLPCRRGGDWHRVHHRADGTIVELCDADRCDRREITRDVLVGFRFCFATLGSQLGAIFGLSGTPAPIDGFQRTFSLGELMPRAGARFPAFLAAAPSAREFGILLERLLGRAQPPFILIIPRAETLTLGTSDLCRQRGVELIVLAEHLVIDDAGKLVCRDPEEDILAAFRERVAGKRDRVTAAAFETPTGATWKDVALRFVDGHTIAVEVLGIRRNFHFTEIGMLNAKSSKPTVQWELLRLFARQHGSISWKTPKPPADLQKRREKLSADLRRFFGIEGDPITVSGSSWQLLFKLDPLL